MNLFEKDGVDYALDELSKLVEKYLGFHISGQSRSGTRIEPRIAESNIELQKAGYLFKEQYEFFHITTMENLFSILNSRNIRLYNLNNSSDEKEYFHAGERTGLLSNEMISRLKDYVHIFSFCPISSLSDNYMWDTYGGSGYKGVSICFRICNDPLKWENYHLSKIRYDDFERFDEFKKAFHQFRGKYSFVEQYIDLSRILPFHKSLEFVAENEVRLLFYPRFNHVQLENYTHYE